MRGQVPLTLRRATAVLLCMWQVWVALLLPSLLLVTAQSSSNAYVIHIQRNDDNDSGTNEACSADKSPSCMCGNVSMVAQHTCDKSKSSESQDSLLGFCQEALTDLNYAVELRNVSKMECMVALTEDELTSTMKSIQSYLKRFTDILDRTIVGVYLKSESQRCTCLEAYKQWLCVTKLPLYTLPNDTSISPTGQSNSSDSEQCILLESRVTLERLRPCLSVCHRVLQACPYYNPSEFQPFRELDNTSCCRFPDEENGSLEIIYGGFPAFDCPDPQLLRMYNIGANRSENRPSYSLESSCIGSRGGSSSVLHIPALTRLSLVALLCVLCVLL